MVPWTHPSSDALAVLTRLTVVTSRQTDRQTDRRTDGRTHRQTDRQTDHGTSLTIGCILFLHIAQRCGIIILCIYVSRPK